MRKVGIEGEGFGQCCHAIRTNLVNVSSKNRGAGDCDEIPDCPVDKAVYDDGVVVDVGGLVELSPCGHLMGTCIWGKRSRF